MPAPPRQPDSSSRPARRGGSGPGRSSAATRAARTSRPARPATSPTGRASARTHDRSTASGPAARAVATTPRPRLTGRAAILVLVLAVLAVSYASSLRAYLQQRDHIESMQSTITERQAEIADLEQEKDRWLDPQYVEIQARERLGYVRPGETPYVALRDGVPLVPESELSKPDTSTSASRAFWEDAWDTVLLAGNPPRRADPPPLTRVEVPDGSTP